MQAKEQILNKLSEHRDELKKMGVARLGLFGSFARGEATESSDLDIIVEFQTGKKTFRNFISVANFLEALLELKVELVTPESISPYFQSEVIKETEYVKVA